VALAQKEQEAPWQQAVPQVLVPMLELLVLMLVLVLMLALEFHTHSRR